MTKKLLVLSIAGLLTLGIAGTAYASQMLELGVMEQVDDQITITLKERTLLIAGAQGETLEVVSLTGKKLMTVNIETPAQRVELTVSKGCYILKVGKVVRKITIR